MISFYLEYILSFIVRWVTDPSFSVGVEPLVCCFSLHGVIADRAGEINCETSICTRTFGKSMSLPVRLRCTREDNPNANICLEDHQQTPQMNLAMMTDRAITIDISPWVLWLHVYDCGLFFLWLTDDVRALLFRECFVPVPSDEVIVAILAALCEIDDNWTPQHNSNSKQNLRG